MAFKVTAQEIITGALKLIGAQAEGETLNGEAATDGLNRLNEFLDALDTQRQARYTLTRSTFAYSPNIGAYTIGPSGDINQVRPDADSIEGAAYIVAPGTDEIPLMLWSPERYASITVKSQTAAAPIALTFDPTSPLGTLTFWPVPTVAATLVLYIKTALTPFADPSTGVTLPKGYARMLRYNLAVILAPEYGKAVDPLVERTARESLADVKRVNYRVSPIGPDAAIGGTGGAYDINSDQVF